MRPTALGVKAALFYTVLITAFYAAPYSNPFFLLLVFLTILGGLSLAWGWTNARRLQGRIADIEPGPAGTRLPIDVVIDGGQAVRIQLEIDGVGAINETERLPTLDRGVYAVRRARLTSTWPLGLLRFARTVPAPSEVVVYPMPAAAGEGGVGPGAEGHNQRVNTDAMVQPAGLREFRAGDEARRVNWKASARRGELVVMEWDGGRGNDPEIQLDRRCEPEVLERALSRLAARALTTRETEKTLTLHTQGLRAVFGGDQRSWDELLRFLAMTEALPADDPGPPPVSPGVEQLP